MTPAQLRAVMLLAGSRADLYAQPLSEAAAEFGIDTPKRLAAWIAQIAHESGELRYVREMRDEMRQNTQRIFDRLDSIVDRSNGR